MLSNNSFLKALAAVSILSGCGHQAQVSPSTAGRLCEVDGPGELLPPTFARIRLGMSRLEVERVLGPPDYSPSPGQFYFSTGGNCLVSDSPRWEAPCGYVVDFHRYRPGPDGESTVADTVQSCSWGGIAE
jgi:hypothetical protein